MRIYHDSMIQTARILALDELAAALARSPGIRCVRLPDPAAVVRGAVLHTPGDPVPEPDALVLCTAPEAGPPDSVAIAIREAAVELTLTQIRDEVAVFAVPDATRWSDAYDRVQWVLGEAFGQVAEDDAYHLADAIATAAGGAVAIEDARRRVVAFSTVAGQVIDEVRRRGILGRQVPDHVERHKWYGRLWRTPGVCEFTDGTESTGRLAIAVRAAGQPLGSIWIIGTRQTLNPDAEEVLERSVDSVAACLAHQDQFAVRSREARAHLLGQLLGPGTNGTELPGPAILVGLARTAEPAEHDLLDERLADVLSLRAHRVSGSGLAAPVDGRVYALFPATDRARLSTYLGDTLARAGSPVRWAAVSDVVEDSAYLPAARRQVDGVLRLRASQSSASQSSASQSKGEAPRLDIVHVHQERRNLLLAELSEAIKDVPMLREGLASQIAEYDRAHGSAYLPTLRAWFETSGDGASAAALLHVHPNTFRYRMSRADSLFGLRLDIADERLLLHVQLRLMDLS
jgi:PucR-like helix-turn-helix protein